MKKWKNARIPVGLWGNDRKVSSEALDVINNYELAVKKVRGIVLYNKTGNTANMNISWVGAKFLQKWLSGDNDGLWLDIDFLENCKREWYDELISIFEYALNTTVLVIDGIYLDIILDDANYKILRTIILQRFKNNKFTVLCVYGKIDKLNMYFKYGLGELISNNFVKVNVE